MVALSIFTLVAVSTAGALLSLLDANAKAQGLKSVMDNLNVAVENMSRTIRFGQGYSCFSAAPSLGYCNGQTGQGFSFTSQKGESVKYYLDGSKIVRSIDGGSAMAMTAPEVTITGLQFFVYGAGAGDGQPRVLVAINGKAGLVESIRSLFAVQTSVSQRQPDEGL